jgi:hypothetical protein
MSEKSETVPIEADTRIVFSGETTFEDYDTLQTCLRQWACFKEKEGK